MMNNTDKKRRELLTTLLKLAIKQPENPVPVPDDVQGFGMIVKQELKAGNCLACQKCVDVCEDDAIRLNGVFDLASFIQLSEAQIKNAPMKKQALYHSLKNLALRDPVNIIEVPDSMSSYGEITIIATNCIACQKCVEICPEQLLEQLNLFDLPEVFSEFSRNQTSQ